MKKHVEFYYKMELIKEMKNILKNLLLVKFKILNIREIDWMQNKMHFVKTFNLFRFVHSLKYTQLVIYIILKNFEINVHLMQ